MQSINHCSFILVNVRRDMKALFVIYVLMIMEKLIKIIVGNVHQ